MAIERNGTPTGTMVERHKLVCATGDTNHNKYWTVDLYDSGDVHIDFGRIGVTSSKGVHRGVGKSFMEKKLKEKKKGKTNKKTGDREPYTEIDAIDSDMGANVSANSTKNLGKANIKSIAKDQIKHTSPETAKLIEFLADVNRHTISDATGGKMTWNVSKGLFQTPLGIVAPSSVSEARTLLIDIADEVAKRSWTKRQFKQNVERFMTIIPQNVGMRWTFESVFPDLQSVQKQNAILDALDASYVSATATPVKGKAKTAKAPKVFETKLKLIENPRVTKRIKDKFRATANRNHYDANRMKLVQAWSVDIEMMTKNFVAIGKKLNNVNEYWHGTNATNVLSILKVGLVIPPASSPHCTGRMWGDGLYFAPSSTKSLNYATGFWGQKGTQRIFMFLADVAMGKEFVPGNNGAWNKSYPVRGHDSVHAVGGRSGVQNDECIVYNTNQANLTYLCEFKY
ncbi:hypothetical protein HN803_04615 [candidate division WWE3 bacterium]|jgi:poly [ADP-ribose] polymerase 2/3/4|nr:hypothetical protein [candidate division WWE3 bacterium]